MMEILVSLPRLETLFTRFLDKSVWVRYRVLQTLNSLASNNGLPRRVSEMWVVYQCLFVCFFVSLFTAVGIFICWELLHFCCEQRMSEKAKDMLIANLLPATGVLQFVLGFQQRIWFYFIYVLSRIWQKSPWPVLFQLMNCCCDFNSQACQFDMWAPITMLKPWFWHLPISLQILFRNALALGSTLSFHHVDESCVAVWVNFPDDS